MADYVDNWISGNMEKELNKKLSPATKKALKESKQKHRATQATSKTRISPLANVRGRIVGGGGAGGAFLENIK